MPLKSEIQNGDRGMERSHHNPSQMQFDIVKPSTVCALSASFLPLISNNLMKISKHTIVSDIAWYDMAVHKLLGQFWATFRILSNFQSFEQLFGFPATFFCFEQVSCFLRHFNNFKASIKVLILGISCFHHDIPTFQPYDMTQWCLLFLVQQNNF